MKNFASTLFATAILATTALAAMSEHGKMHAPSVRRAMHSQKKRTSCSSSSSSKKSKKNKKKHHHHKSSSSSSDYSSGSSSGSSGSGSSSSDSDDTTTDSTDNDSTSSTTTSSSNATSSGSGKNITLSGKQGLAWPNSNGMKIDNFFIGDVDWYYSWGATPGWDDAPTDKLFCPMLWGDKNAADFNEKVTQDPSGKFNGYKCAFGMNEVNQVGQSDMTVSAGCSLMEKYIMPLADDGWYIIGPSTTSAPDGLTWYKSFMTECKTVFDRLDAVAVHYYDVDVTNFQKYVENWHTVTGKDIWITEAACQNFNGGAQCTSSQAYSFLTEMTAWVDKTDYVKAYSPFGVMENLQGVDEVNRLSTGSTPTALFKAFAEGK